MRKRLISICIVVIFVCSIYGCAQIAEETFDAEMENVEPENTEIESEEEADAVDTEAESEETAISEEEYRQSEEQTDPIADEPEEQEVEKIDSISQLNIIGRTQEETNLIREILSKHEEEFEAFLMEDWEYPHIQWWVEVDGYDFTGDGEEEIIVSKCDVLQDMTVSYNYVYDREGNKLLEFAGDLMNTKIINGWNGDGTFLLYITGAHAADIGAGIYTEIKWENGELEEHVKLIEYDTRDGASQNAGKKEGYYIIKDITKEEEEKLLEGASGIYDLTKTKGYVREDKDLDEYMQLFDTAKTEEFSLIGGILYWEPDGFVWK